MKCETGTAIERAPVPAGLEHEHHTCSARVQAVESSAGHRFTVQPWTSHLASLGFLSSVKVGVGTADKAHRCCDSNLQQTGANLLSANYAPARPHHSPHPQTPVTHKLERFVLPTFPCTTCWLKPRKIWYEICMSLRNSFSPQFTLLVL